MRTAMTIPIVRAIVTALALATIVAKGAGFEYVRLGELGVLQFAKCPAGTFLMGPNRQDYAKFDNVRVTRVKLDEFSIAITEAPQSLWEATTGIGSFQDFLRRRHVDHMPNDIGPQLPIFGLSYYEAIHFCELLTSSARLQRAIPNELEIRLPTEAEWEYACRAGTNTLFSFGDRLESQMANVRKPGLGKLAVVDKFPGNSWGILSMHGNVAEWVIDAYSAYPLESNNPVRLQYYDIRRPKNLVRGGAFECVSGAAESRARTAVVPWKRTRTIGFRFVLARPIPVTGPVGSNSTFWD